MGRNEGPKKKKMYPSQYKPKQQLFKVSENMALTHDVISTWNSSYELVTCRCEAMNVTVQPLCWDHESGTSAHTCYSLPPSSNTKLLDELR
jgi:hypothetical protein